MADLETRVDKIEDRLHVAENKIDVLAQQVQDFVAESRAARSRTDAELKKFRTNQDALDKHMDETIIQIQNLTTVILIEIAVLVVSILFLMWKIAAK